MRALVFSFVIVLAAPHGALAQGDAAHGGGPGRERLTGRHAGPVRAIQAPTAPPGAPRRRPRRRPARSR